MKNPALAINLAERNYTHNFGAFALEVHRKSGPVAMATEFGSSETGPDGGFAVPVDTANEILMYATGALLPLCREIPVRGGGIGIPLDACSPWTDAGIQAFWPDDEGDELQASLPKLGLTSFELKKLTAFVPASDELLEDSAALQAWLPLAMGEAVKVKVNDAIINGIGGARPLGILPSTAIITIAAEAGQAADTINSANLGKMLDRHLNPMGAIWLANPGTLSNLITCSCFDHGTGKLAGRDIVLTDACKPLGDRGDIVLADMAGYVVASKIAQLASSMHLWFDQDMTAFRLTFRWDGAPMLSAPVTPPNATATKSHFVALQARA